MYVNPYVKDLYRVKFHDERGGVLRLDMNENPEGLPPDFVEEVKRKITPGFLATYPEKDRLTGMLAKVGGVRPENITVTSGSDEALRLVFQCFGEPGKKLVSVLPTFEMYGVYAKMYGMEHVTVPYQEGFAVSGGAVEAAIDSDTGMVILLNPNSPIGTVYPEEEVAAVIRRAEKVGAIVVIDEAYHYFYPQTFLPMIRSYDHVLVLRTFSKIFSIAGLRIGYAAGDSRLIDIIEKAQSTFNVNNVAILFAEELWKRPGLIEQLRAGEAEGRSWLAVRLKDAGYNPISLEGNFVLLRPKRPSGEVVAALKAKKIWVRDYGSGILEGYIRVSTGGIGCMRAFWKAFEEVED